MKEKRKENLNQYRFLNLGKLRLTRSQASGTLFSIQYLQEDDMNDNWEYFDLIEEKSKRERLRSHSSRQGALWLYNEARTPHM